MSSVLSRYLDRRDSVYARSDSALRHKLEAASRTNTPSVEPELQAESVKPPSYVIITAPPETRRRSPCAEDDRGPHVDQYEAAERARDRMYRRGYYRDDEPEQGW